MDAAECPPTFGTDHKKITGIIAGGYETLIVSKEGVEDNREAAVKALTEENLSSNDFVIGLAASRRTPFTLAGLEYAQSLGSSTAFIICNKIDDSSQDSVVIKQLKVRIELPVGPEVIAGSTRMKSGTAQKMALNMISTAAMVLLGKTYGNIMVDLQARSEKLAARSRKILIDLLGVDLSVADQLLQSAGGSVKEAIIMHHCNCNSDDAKAKLAETDGFLTPIVEKIKGKESK